MAISSNTELRLRKATRILKLLTASRLCLMTTLPFIGMILQNMKEI